MPRATGPAHPLHLQQQRGGGWRARAGRVHVTIRPTAALTLGLAGWLVDGSPDRVLLWVLAGLGAIVTHEVAHAWVGRLGGTSAYIEVGWLGGITRWQPPGTLSRPAEAAALLAGPLVGAAAGWGALLGSQSLAPMDGLAVGLATDALALFALVSMALAALDVLPIFPRDGARLLLLVVPGPPVTAVVRVATIGAVAAALATGLRLPGPAPALALVTGILLLTNTWLAIRGDRAVGRPVPEAIDRRDWSSVRHRILQGLDSPDLAAMAQGRALAISDFHAAADIGDAALARGWRTIGFARRTARARAFLEQDDLAVARVHDAVAFGADPEELAQDGILRHLATRTDWPSPALPRRSRRHQFAVDLRERASESA